MSQLDPYPDYPFPGGWRLIPRYMHSGVYNYVMYGVPVGHFLTALFSDASISTVVECADDANQASLLGWMQFLYNYFPANAKGSREAVDAWIKQGGLQHAKNAAD